MLLSAIVAVAVAEPPVGDPGAEGVPLAIPVGRPPPAAPRRGPRLDDAYVAALDAYRRESIRVRPYETLTYGTTGWVGWGGWGWGGWGWGPGWGWGVGVPTVWVDRHQRIGVYEGERRLDVPGTLRALEEPERAAGLERRVRKNRTWAGVGTAVGATGVVGSIVSLVGVQTSYDPVVRDAWAAGMLGSSVAMASGFVFSAIPGARAERLRFDPLATFEPGELESSVEAHNAALAERLGLTPADVARLGDGR